MGSVATKSHLPNQAGAVLPHRRERSGTGAFGWLRARSIILRLPDKEARRSLAFGGKVRWGLFDRGSGEASASGSSIMSPRTADASGKQLGRASRTADTQNRSSCNG